MRIGLTYDLRSDYLDAGFGLQETAEFDSVETVEAIEVALQILGHSTDRVGRAARLIERLAAGERWDLVFNICEGMYGVGREAQVPAILDIFQIPYTFSDPCIMALCLDKALTKRILHSFGIPTPVFATIENVRDLEKLSAWQFPLFAKPVAEGTSKGINSDSIVRNWEQLEQTCQRLLIRFQQPVLVEEFLPGREFTVGILGTGVSAKVLGTLEIILRGDAEPEVYSYKNKEFCEELVEYRLVHSASDSIVAVAEELALSAWRCMGCRDAGRVDLRCDISGSPQLIEINPLAGLHPTHSDLPMLASVLRMDYRDLIDCIVRSAMSRCAHHLLQSNGWTKGKMQNDIEANIAPALAASIETTRDHSLLDGVR